MNLKILLILCSLAFVANARNTKEPLLIVVLLRYSREDFGRVSNEMTAITKNKLTHGRIHLPPDKSAESIANLLATGQSSYLGDAVDPVWNQNQSRVNGKTICVNWPYTDLMYGPRRCESSWRSEPIFFDCMEYVIGRFHNGSANLAMMYFKDKQQTKDFDSEIRCIYDLLIAYKVSDRTSVFVIYQDGDNAEQHGQYYSFGPHIKQSGTIKDVPLTTFHHRFCDILKIDCDPKK